MQKNDAIEPVWMDLAYVPHHGSSEYANAEFFKRVRARYYVFSGVEPSKEVFNALLEAKKTWENKEQGKERWNFGGIMLTWGDIGVWENKGNADAVCTDRP